MFRKIPKLSSARFNSVFLLYSYALRYQQYKKELKRIENFKFQNILRIDVLLNYLFQHAKHVSTVMEHVCDYNIKIEITRVPHTHFALKYRIRVCVIFI